MKTITGDRYRLRAEERKYTPLHEALERLNGRDLERDRDIENRVLRSRFCARMGARNIRAEKRERYGS